MLGKHRPVVKAETGGVNERDKQNGDCADDTEQLQWTSPGHTTICSTQHVYLFSGKTSVQCTRPSVRRLSQHNSNRLVRGSASMPVPQPHAAYIQNDSPGGRTDAASRYVSA